VLWAALNRAVKWQLVGRNVALLVDSPRVPKVEIVPFSPEVATRFLTAAEGHRLAHLFEFLLATGLRLGEALGLQWPDVDLAAANSAGELGVSLGRLDDGNLKLRGRERRKEFFNVGGVGRGRFINTIDNEHRARRGVHVNVVTRDFFPDVRERHAKLRQATPNPEPPRAGEDEVNRILQSVHSDHATLRRYLVDAGLLRRERGVYRRA